MCEKSNKSCINHQIASNQLSSCNRSWYTNMEFPSFGETFPGFLFDEGATPDGECIEIAEWKEVLEKIMGELKKEPQLWEKIKDMLRANSEDLPLFGCLFSNDAFKKIFGEYVAQCKQQIKVGSSGKKNTATATSIRLFANQLFVKREYRGAFKMYTRGLMFAKDDDDETPLLYANRSAVYFQLNQFENTLEDIERALKFGYGQLKPIGKLLIRKGLSLLALGRDEQVKELLVANMPANEDGPDFAQWQQLKEELENVNRQLTKRDITLSQLQNVSTVSAALTSEGVFRPHERFPWLNAKIDLRYDEKKKEFYLVSREEMKYGEIVALSKPFVSLDPKRNSYERCHYCMVPCFETPKYFSDNAKLAHEPKLSPNSLRMVTPLACPECCNVLYCSEACRTAAWTAYHRFECSQMAILAKINSESHLALRMLYMIGSLEQNSPTLQMLDELKTASDPGALMIDQQAYSFVYSNPLSMMVTLDMSLERVLTGFFLLKLVQMSDFLIEPKNITDRVYMEQAFSAYFRIARHRIQSGFNVAFARPFTDPTTLLTVSPFPVLLVDGMKSMLKHSCEANVATSSLLNESFESNVNLLYATGGVPAGTKLTLDYDIDEPTNPEEISFRENQLGLRYILNCNCSRCVRSKRDSLNHSDGIYFPIACSVCGSLMVRADGEEGGDSSSVLDDSYGCSSSDGCNFKYSAQQMKNIYERMGNVMEAKRSVGDCRQETYSEFQTKVYQLKTTTESMASFLYGRSLFLAHLYGNLARCYLIITMAPISNSYSGPITRITSETHTLHRGHLTTSLLYLNKVFDILESMKQGPGVRTHLSDQLGNIFGSLDRLEVPINYQQLFELKASIEQVQRRYEAFLKMTAYNTMLASSLVAKE